MRKTSLILLIRWFQGRPRLGTRHSMQNRHATAAMFPPVNVTAATTSHPPAVVDRHEPENTRLLRDLLAAQDRQNELLEELVNQLSANQKQRTQELTNWKNANPELAQHCR